MPFTFHEHDYTAAWKTREQFSQHFLSRYKITMRKYDWKLLNW